MNDRATRRPLRRGPHFDSLEARAVMSHMSAAAAFEAHLLKAEQAAVHRAMVQASHMHATQVHAALPADTTGTNSTGGGNNLGPVAGQNPQVTNTFSSTDVFSNYIGGSIGLQAFVDGLYTNVLHRPADSDGEAFWIGTLESGRYTPFQVVNLFQTSAEGTSAGLTPLQPAGPQNVYTAYLGGDVGVRAFVDGLYADVLHTAPDPAGEAFWVGAIERGGVTPYKVTFTFLGEVGIFQPIS